MSFAVERTLREKPGQLMTEYIASLVSKVLPRVANIQTTMNGFKSAEQWPVDRYVFTDANFFSVSGHLFSSGKHS
jgi:hypothetical protein